MREAPQRRNFYAASPSTPGIGNLRSIVRRSFPQPQRTGACPRGGLPCPRFFFARYASRLKPLCAALAQMREQKRGFLRLRGLNSFPQHSHLASFFWVAASWHSFEQYLAECSRQGATSNIRPHCAQIRIGILPSSLHAAQPSPFPSGR